MTRIVTALVVALALFLGSPLAVFAGATDNYIKELADKDPKVRAKAAYELSCG